MKKIYIILATALAMVFGTSCNNLLDISQHGVLNYETYYQTDEEADAASAALYYNLRSINYYYTMMKNSFTDDFWSGGGSRNDNAELEECNEWTFDTEQSYIQGLFETYYTMIYKANVIFGHVPCETDVQQRVHAEAKVFRALCYFELISMWGNPPLVDHELEASEYNVPNGTTEELWALVETDLTEAIESGTLAEKSGVNDESTWRVTKQYAQALLGKAYLWQEKYAEAAEQFDAVINSGLYALYTGDYGDILQHDHKFNCESLFESSRIDDSNNVWDNTDITYLMIHWRTDTIDVPDGYLYLGWGFLCPQQSLMDAFAECEGTENGYRRKQTFMTWEEAQDKGFGMSGTQVICEGYLMWKWRVQEDSAPSAGYGYTNTNNPRWMRLAEVYLCGAEAHLLAGNQSKADEYVNAIRTRAQLSSKSGVTENDIRLEKRCELCGEGVRYQDILRWGIGVETMGNQGEKLPWMDANGNVTYKSYNSSGTYGFQSPKHDHLPYPGVEIRLNSAIQQNPGW